MPLHHIRLLDPSQITVNRERFRSDVGNIKELAESIQRFGLLSPVIVEENGELIAGFRRLSAMKSLGWSQIPTISKGDLTELEAREIELEENIRRKQMDWLEEQKAIVELHRLHQVTDPNWSQDSTAALIGSTRGKASISDAKMLVSAAELFPEIKEAKTKTQAVSWARALAQKVGRTIAVGEARKAGDAATVSTADKIILGDSVEVIKSMPDGFIDAVITDPPFGIDYDERKMGSESQMTSYEDSEESYERLLSMAPDLYRVIKPNGWLIWFFGMSWYERCKAAFRSAGFTVDELPIIWDRSDGRSYTTRPDRYFGRSYDVALHCLKGEPEIIQRGKGNIIKVAPVGTQEREATVERPVGLYAELIQRLTVKGELVVDFFAGSGACLVAAAQLQRDFIGVEMDPHRHALAVSRVAASIPGAGK